MSLPILLQAIVFLLYASQSPSRAPFSASAAHIRLHQPHQSRKISAQFATQPGLASAGEVGLVCKGSVWSSGPLTRGHHLCTLQFLGCISFSTQKLGISVGFLDTLRTRRHFCTERTHRVQVTPRELSLNSSASLSHCTNGCTEAPRGRRLAAMTGAGQCSE